MLGQCWESRSKRVPSDTSVADVALADDMRCEMNASSHTGGITNVVACIRVRSAYLEGANNAGEKEGLKGRFFLWCGICHVSTRQNIADAEDKRRALPANALENPTAKRDGISIQCVSAGHRKSRV
eukprot:2402055-Rhodomonas_salina.3